MAEEDSYQLTGLGYRTWVLAGLGIQNASKAPVVFFHIRLGPKFYPASLQSSPRELLQCEDGAG
ncbi:MAG: hypothetical protein SV775_14260 [Thermodesulfobacteriota bacterium]|nr:hypothetical protein [Thermodesulfobacteriota bacterium]